MQFNKLQILLVRWCLWHAFIMLSLFNLLVKLEFSIIFAPHAEVAELVDALDSKSCILGCVGSSPTFGT